MNHLDGNRRKHFSTTCTGTRHVAQTNEADLFVVDAEIVGLSRSTDTYGGEDHLLNGQVAFPAQ